MKPLVFDASALIELIEDDRRADHVRHLIRKAQVSQDSMHMSAVNWGELYYVVWRHHGQATAEEALVRLAQIPILLTDADSAQAKQAAIFHAKFALPYADCFAAALAVTLKARLVTADSDFERIRRFVNLLRLV